MFNRTSETQNEVGLAAVYLGDEVVVFGGFVIRGRPLDGRIDPRYAGFAFRMPQVRKQIVARGQGAIRSNIGQGELRQVLVSIPPLEEQRVIANALCEADALIESLEQLLAKKRRITQGASQALLTGEKRLPGFDDEWRVRCIADVASPSSERNSAAQSLPVLTCSKHRGFVDSLSYFKNQVFSRDTSPIYVVFAMKPGVDSYFLHRLLKLDVYRRRFSVATSSSVDRRGSLRWPAFSQLEVVLPSEKEQMAIGAVLRDMAAEIAAVDAQLLKARHIKQGMMQNLLTGKIRLV